MPDSNTRRHPQSHLEVGPLPCIFLNIAHHIFDLRDTIWSTHVKGTLVELNNLLLIWFLSIKSVKPHFLANSDCPQKPFSNRSRSMRDLHEINWLLTVSDQFDSVPLSLDGRLHSTRKTPRSSHPLSFDSLGPGASAMTRM